MARALQWTHGLKKEEAKCLLERELKDRGYAKHVSWEAYGFRVSVGPFGTWLNASGEVTDDDIVVKKVGGLFSGPAETKAREVLQRLFPQ